MQFLETEGLTGRGSSARAVWLGTEFVDETTRDSTRKVIIAATAMTVLQVLVTLVAVFHDGFKRRGITSALVNLATGLLLPAVGYFGAVRSDSAMMCCFCGCNLAAAMLQVLLLAGVAWILKSIDSDVGAMCSASCATLSCGVGSGRVDGCSCEPECMAREDLLCCFDFAQFCLSAADGGEAAACDDSGITWATMMVAGTLLVLITPTICLSCYAWWHGLALWRRLSAGEQLTAGHQQSLGLEPTGDDADGAE